MDKRLSLLAEQVLDVRAGDGKPDSCHVGVVGHQLHALEQGSVALAKLPRGRERARASEEQVDALLCGSGRWQQAQSRAQPVRCTTWRPAGSRLSCLAQARDPCGIALTRRELHMAGTCRRRGAAAFERCSASLVSADPPSARARFVDRSPDERMTEPKSSRDIRAANQLELQQLVERGEHRFLVHARSSRSQVRVERIAGDGGAFEDFARVWGEEPKLLCECRGDEWRNIHPANRELR